MSELRKNVASLTKAKELLEEELANVKEAIGRATIKLSPRPQHKSSRSNQLGATGQKSSTSSLASGTGNGNGNTTQELHSMVERLHLLENERKVLRYVALPISSTVLCACVCVCADYVISKSSSCHSTIL